MIKMRISELLEGRKQSFYWLAGETGITHSTLSKLRHSTIKEIRLEVIEKLCESLECAPGDLFDYIPDQPAKKTKPKS